MRHPKMCIRTVMARLCHFGAKCAYKHKRMSNSQDYSKDTVSEDLQKLREEVDDLKTTINLLVSNRDQEESLKKSMEEIKAEMKILAASNRYIKERTDLFEEDSKYSDNESASVDVKKSNRDEKKKLALDYKCGDCDFVGNTCMSLKKHINTKYKLDNHEIKRKNHIIFQMASMIYFKWKYWMVNKFLNAMFAMKVLIHMTK